MALFIVLWLLIRASKCREAVGGYFKDPTGTTKQVGATCGRRRNFTVSKDNMSS